MDEVKSASEELLYWLMNAGISVADRRRRKTGSDRGQRSDKRTNAGGNKYLLQLHSSEISLLKVYNHVAFLLATAQAHVYLSAIKIAHLQTHWNGANICIGTSRAFRAFFLYAKVKMQFNK